MKLYFRGELIKVHPKVDPGRRQTDPADLLSDLTVYAMRDLNTLQRKAFGHGAYVGAAAALPGNRPSLVHSSLAITPVRKARRHEWRSC
ncbi:hypothetical protein ACIHDR_45755 [Nocardia sp. NPDC052278]|uniref:hypothetical protein n=1 Tax=unclassified Nocardia TaxID=2637762 RepID=UPI0036C56849